MFEVPRISDLERDGDILAEPQKKQNKKKPKNPSSAKGSGDAERNLPRARLGRQSGDRPGEEEDAVLGALAFPGGRGRDLSHRQAHRAAREQSVLMRRGHVAKGGRLER